MVPSGEQSPLLFLLVKSAPAGSYVVQPGDYLLRICRQFGYTLNELVAYNHIVNPDLI